MSTALVLGNGSMLVNINDLCQVTDFYFPYVGQENHLSTFVNKLFFRINGEFVQITRNNFDIDINYQEDSLVGHTKLKHKKTGLEIDLIDLVIQNDQIFLRNFEIKNNTKNPIEIYVYFQNNFAIYSYDIGDTTVWYQPGRCLVHYKQNRYVGIGSTKKIYQFTCAARTDNDNRGAYPDLKTGELNFNPISNGSVNSCVSYKFNIPPGETMGSNYFNVTGMSFQQLEKSIDNITSCDLGNTCKSTVKYWQNWVRSKSNILFRTKGTPSFFGEYDLDSRIYSLYKRSLLTIRTQIDNGGAIIAANDGRYLKEGGKDTYSYFWPRDGAYIILALIECGFKELSDEYFEYIENLLTPEGYFLHKYYPHSREGRSALGSSWHPWVDNSGSLQEPIQEDETALNVYAIWKHYEHFADQEFLKKYWNSLIFPMANFLGNYRYTIVYDAPDIQDYVSGFPEIAKEDEFIKTYSGSKLPKASYDLWEERRGISAFTCSTVYAGLLAASNLSEVFGRTDLKQIFLNYANEIKEATINYLFNEDLGRFITHIICDSNTSQPVIDTKLDASLYSLWHFGLLDVNDPRIEKTMWEVEDKLTVRSEIGGIARRENDHYNTIDSNLVGNPWFICTLWLAQYWTQKDNYDKAKKYIRWAVDHADKSGLMAEQAHPHTGHGESVKPLTWSHGAFVRTINMLWGKIYKGTYQIPGSKD
ncbi:hypothetical protein GF362_02705 [Candidatus Dojkabacteria bacterium]|nr:hypothetical protein [Candidatus Dojkabacteria bacterium]